MSDFPYTLEDVTPGWLAEVLHGPVIAFRVVDAHDGTTGRGLIEVEYRGEAELPRRLFLKFPPTDEMQRAFVVSSGMGRREALFYRQLSREVPVRVPHCYYANASDGGEQYIMLLEDLEESGCTFRNAGNRYSMAYLRSVLSAFADLHGAYWDSSRFADDLDWIEPPVQHPIGAQLVERALELHADEMPPVFTELGKLYLAQTDAIHKLWEVGVPTLVHGDVHDGNQFCDGDTPGFYDWALMAKGPAMRDVGYFLAGTLKREDVQHLAELLGFYRERLVETVPQAPSVEELLEGCRRHAAYVWVGAAATLAMGDEWQPTSYVRSTLERLHANLEAIGSVDAITQALS
jgi:hypothetical protein